MNSYDYYKNMREEDSGHFDKQWSQMANQLGYKSSTMNNRLEYGGGQKPQKRMDYESRGLAMPEP